MANNKFYGYKPKPSKGNVGIPYGEDTKFTNQNPYEFRKGMDYELTSLGCSRLRESTPDEREKATETVLKNLDTHPSYYSGLIQFESGMNQAGKINGGSFKTWLSDYFDTTNYKEVQNVWKRDKMKDANHKNDQMIKIKEALKKQIKAALYEAKDKDIDDEDEEVTAVKATKGAKKAEKGMARFEKEEIAIDELLYGKQKGEEEVSEENPGKGSLLFLKNKYLDVYKQDKDVEKYKKSIILPDVINKKLEKHVAFFSKLGNNISSNELKGKDIPNTIKKLEIRKTSINKEREEAQSEIGKQRNEIASTDMSRANHLRLLEIIRENGISLREGTDSIRVYYEIAKQSYLEGLSKGLRL